MLKGASLRIGDVIKFRNLNWCRIFLRIIVRRDTFMVPIFDSPASELILLQIRVRRRMISTCNRARFDDRYCARDAALHRDFRAVVETDKNCKPYYPDPLARASSSDGNDPAILQHPSWYLLTLIEKASRLIR